METRPYRWEELTSSEQAEAIRRGFARGANIRYVLRKSREPCDGLVLIRWQYAR